MTDTPTGKLARFTAPLELRLAGLWASTMFCFVYADLVGFWVPGRIEATAKGDLGPLGTATPEVLVGVAICMAIPSLMVALSLLAPARANRLLNLLFGTLYTLITLATLRGAPPFYWLFGAIEIGLTATIVWQAWRWPRVE
jgi:hypothetical protein